MIYDLRDSARVRNWLAAITALAWIAVILKREVANGMAMNAPGELAGNWVLMVVAMMAPVLIQPIQFVRGSSLLRRRLRSTTLFVGGYAVVWSLVGSMMMSVAICAGLLGSPPYAAAVAMVAVALAWQCSPAKQICLNRCHLLPNLARFGRAADRDAFFSGLTHGGWCAGSCWAWMLSAMLLPAGHTAAMAIATILIFCERLDAFALPRWRVRGLGKACRVLVAQISMWTRRPLAGQFMPRI